MQAELTDNVVLFTGGDSGIGLAVVEIFAQRRATVGLNHLSDDLRGPDAVRRLQALGHDVFGAPGSVSVDIEADALVNGAIDRKGRLDYLVTAQLYRWH